jgi:hypothetical protein
LIGRLHLKRERERKTERDREREREGEEEGKRKEGKEGKNGRDKREMGNILQEIVDTKKLLFFSSSNDGNTMQ